jgi:hypothetical protein
MFKRNKDPFVLYYDDIYHLHNCPETVVSSCSAENRLPMIIPVNPDCIRIEKN